MNYEVTLNYSGGRTFKRIFDDIGNAAEYALAAREIGEDSGDPCTTVLKEVAEKLSVEATKTLDKGNLLP
jgi:hypothetical protein